MTQACGEELIWGENCSCSFAEQEKGGGRESVPNGTPTLENSLAIFKTKNELSTHLNYI